MSQARSCVTEERKEQCSNDREINQEIESDKDMKKEEETNWLRWPIAKVVALASETPVHLLIKVEMTAHVMYAGVNGEDKYRAH